MSVREPYTPPPLVPVPAGHELASVGLRIGGGLIDLVLFYIFMFAIVFLLTGVISVVNPQGFSRREDMDTLGGIVVFFAIFGTFFAYYILTEAVWGATPAKMMLGMRTVRGEDGLPIDWGRAFGRNLLRVVDGFFFYLVGILTLSLSKRTQRVGDMVANTLVVKIRN